MLGETGWEPIKTITGSESYGGSYKGHNLEVWCFATDVWGWSMTHPSDCSSRGTGGAASTRKQAESRAMTAVEKCKEIVRSERARRGESG